MRSPSLSLLRLGEGRSTRRGRKKEGPFRPKEGVNLRPSAQAIMTQFERFVYGVKPYLLAKSDPIFRARTM